MPGFIYFIPGIKLATAGNLAQRGFDYLDDGGSMSSREVHGGPEGLIGAAVALGAGTVSGYHPDKQTWHKCDGGKFWVGYETDNPPGPDDLARRELIGGHNVQLAAGTFLIPIARSIVQGSTLPQTIVLGPNGELLTKPLRRFSEICADAESFWQQFRRDNGDESAGGEQLTDQDLWRIAVAALAINYRLGPWECSALDLIDTQSLTQILFALIDMPSVMAVIEAETAARKKKEGAEGAATPDGSSTNAGDQGPSPDTSPPSPTSTGSPTKDAES